MKLILTEYINSLKEDGELDKMVQDILKASGVTVFTKTQRGRQFGVDVYAVGPDFDGDSQKKVYLITVKQGDLTRQVWNGDQNAVYQSLDEIKTVFIRSNLAKQHQKLPIKIIVAFNGELHQSLQQSWRGYEESNPEYEYALWPICWFVEKFEEKLLNEHSFSNAIRSEIRKTIIHLENPDYDLADFTRLLNLLSADYKKIKSKKGRLKLLKELHVIISIILKYCEQADNLLHAVRVVEMYFLMLWSELIPEKPEKEYTQSFVAAHQLVTDTLLSYYNKLGYVAQVKDGFSRGHGSSVTYTASLYNQLGIFALTGLSAVFMDELLIGPMAPVVDQIKQLYRQKAEEIADAVIHTLNNNKIFYSPRADDQHIEICLVFLLLHKLGRQHELKSLLYLFNEQIGEGILFSNVFPLLSNDKREIAELEIDYTKRNEHQYGGSNLLTVLIERCVVTGDEANYHRFKMLKDELLAETALLLWFPEKETEELLYTKNATRDSGYALSDIELPKTLGECADIIRREYEHNCAEKEFTFLKNGFWIIGLIASRHYRTYVFPHYWRQLLPKETGTKPVPDPNALPTTHQPIQ
jgi:hypothetical protein